MLELQKAAEHNAHWRNSLLLVSEKYQHWHSPLATRVISDKHMAQIADTQTPPGIIAVAPLPVASKLVGGAEDDGRAIYLYEVQDPGNLGTILRSLAWFGGFRCLLSPNAVDPYNPKVVRASMGAIFHVPLELDVELAELSRRYSRIACLDMGGAPIASPAFAEQQCYVFGNEARGVPREPLQALGASAFTIAGGGAIESLNLASALNMCVYELMR